MVDSYTKTKDYNHEPFSVLMAEKQLINMIYLDESI